MATKAQPKTQLPAKKQAGVIAKRGPQAPGRGFEEADAAAYAIPFLVMLQPTSPQLDEIKGAKAGMILNTATGEVMNSAEVIPCVYQRRFLRWGPRDSGGGFKGAMVASEADKLRNEGDVTDFENRVYFPLPDGTVNPKKCDLLADTRNHYVLVRTKEGLKPAVMSLASTQVKVSRNWMTKMQSAGGDMWGWAYKIGSQKTTNEKGTWYLFTVDYADEATESEQEVAEAFYASVVSGSAQAKFDKDGQHARE
jgi:hypothetical protein